jgi:hypothetical protein
MAKKWTLESLTIGPQTHMTNYSFWHDAFQNFPPSPHMRELAIVYHYRNVRAFDPSCWVYFDSLFSRRDIFPRFMKVDVHATIRSSSFSYEQRQALYGALYSLRSCRSVTFRDRE